MAISLIGSASTEATSITIPGSYQAGDLLIINSYRNTSTAPTLPAGWTSAGTFSTASHSGTLGWKVAASSSETSGTWTNATGLVCLVYRGQRQLATPVGTPVHNASAGTTATYGALTLSGSGTSWVVGFLDSTSTAANTTPAPTGLTLETHNTSPVSITEAGYDSNGPLISWTSQTQALGSSVTWSTYVIEVFAEPDNTFGDPSSYTNTSNSSAAAKIANSAIPYSSGTVQTLTATLDMISGTVTARGVIYSDSAGSPNSLLAQTDSQTISNTTLQAITFNFTGGNQISVTAGTPYWIGVWWGTPTGAGSINWGRGAVSAAADKSSDTAGGPASTFGTVTTISGPLGVTVAYTTGGAAADSTPHLLTMGVG